MNPMNLTRITGTMATNADLLTLTQWLSPSFPVGAFAYSHGLETAIADGTIASAAALLAWLGDVVAHGTGRNDCILLRAAHASRSASELADIDATARAFCATSERLLEARLQGQAFCATTAAIWPGDVQDLLYPVAVGAAAAREAIDVDITAALYLHGFVSNLVSVAVRAVPLGQTEGQGVLHALSPLVERVARETASVPLDDLHATAFVSDIAAFRHETLQPRIFRS